MKARIKLFMKDGGVVEFSGVVKDFKRLTWGRGRGEGGRGGVRGVFSRVLYPKVMR